MVSVGRGPESTIDQETVGMFMGHMHAQGYAPSTINSAVAAISFVFKWKGEADPTNCFYVRSLQKGLGKLARPDTRQSVDVGDLEKIALQLKAHPEETMLMCLFKVAFFGLCRMGELVGSGPHVLLASNLSIVGNSVQITMPTYKHSKRSATINLARREDAICPVKAAELYIESRPTTTSTQFFVCRNGKPISMASVGKIVKAIGLRMAPAKILNGHSFRIGGATHAAKRGASDDEIKRLGRWESGAFSGYLRGGVFN